MSRLAKLRIPVPPKTEVTLNDGFLTVKGPKGTLVRKLTKFVDIDIAPEGIQVNKRGNSLDAQAQVGTYASHMRNMLTGVNEGFVRKLIVEGVGFKWDVSGTTLNLALGFSHPVKMPIPQGVTAIAEKGVLTLSSFDKELLGQFAADVRAQKKPEPYKGKGIRYEGEVIRRKQGKKAS